MGKQIKFIDTKFVIRNLRQIKLSEKLESTLCLGFTCLSFQHCSMNYRDALAQQQPDLYKQFRRRLRSLRKIL